MAEKKKTGWDAAVEKYEPQRTQQATGGWAAAVQKYEPIQRTKIVSSPTVRPAVARQQPPVQQMPVQTPTQAEPAPGIHFDLNQTPYFQSTAPKSRLQQLAEETVQQRETFTPITPTTSYRDNSTFTRYEIPNAETNAFRKITPVEQPKEEPRHDFSKSDEQVMADRKQAALQAGINWDELNALQRGAGTVAATVSGAGKQAAASALGVGAAIYNENTKSGQVLAWQNADTTAREMLQRLKDGEDASDLEFRLKSQATYYGGPEYADRLINYVREKAAAGEEDINIDDAEPINDYIFSRQQENVQGLYNTMQDLSTSGAQDLQTAKYLNLIQSDFGDKLVDAGSFAVQSAVDAGIAATLHLTGTSAAYIPFALRAFGGSYNEALTNMQNMGQVIGSDAATKAAQYGTAAAGIEVATEMLWGMAGAMGAVKKGALDDQTMQAIGNAIAKLADSEAGKQQLRKISEFALGGVFEGVEEVVGDLLSYVLNTAGIYDQSKARNSAEDWKRDWEETGKELWNSFAGGALSGWMGSGARAAINPAVQRQTGNKLKSGTFEDYTGAPMTAADLVENAGAAEEGTELANTLQDLIRKYGQDGDYSSVLQKATDTELGRLYEAYENTTSDSFRSQQLVHDAINEADARRSGKLPTSYARNIVKNDMAMQELANLGYEIDNNLSYKEKIDDVKSYVEELAEQQALVRELSNQQNETKLDEEAVNALREASKPTDISARSTASLSLDRAAKFGNTQNWQQTVANNAVTSAQNDIKTMLDANQISGLAAETIQAQYQFGQDTQKYFDEMNSAVQAGREGRTLKSVGTPQTITIDQQRNAFRAGRAEFNQEAENARLRLRESGERNDGQSAGEQTAGLAEGTGRAQEGQRGTVSGKKGLKRLRKESLSRESLATIGLVDETDNPRQDIREAKEYVTSKGMNFVAWSGGAMYFEGERYGVRGFYDPKTNTVYVRTDHEEITAGQIARHEATHGDIHNGKVRIGTARGNSTEVEFGTVRDALIETLGGVKQLDDLLDKYVAAYRGTGLSEQEVWEELVCDAMGDMNELAYRGHGEDARKIAVRMQQVKDATSANYNPEGKNKTPASGKSSREMNQGPPDSLGKNSIDMFADAAGVDAYKTASGQILFFVNGRKTNHITVTDIKNHSAIGTLIKTAVANGFISEEEADIQYESAAKLMNMIMTTQDPELTWAWAGAAMFSALKKNSDGQYGTTIDFTTVCRKTQEMVTAMSNAMKEAGRGLTRDEVVGLQHKVYESGAEVPCPVCYVFSRWAGVGEGVLDKIANLQKKYANYTQEEIAKRTEELRKQIIERGLSEDGKVNLSHVTQLRGEMEDEYSDLKYLVEQYEDGNKLKKTKAEYEQAKARLKSLDIDIGITSEWTWASNVVSNPDYKPVPNNILFDLDAGAEFATKYPVVWKYRSTRGPAAGKAILPYSSMRYGDIILGVDPKGNKHLFTDNNGKTIVKDHMTAAQKDAVKSAIRRTAAQNLIGGQRFQSTSDFRYEYALDYIQAFWELQALGSKMQTYTKVVEFADMVAAVGGDVNLSVMPLRSGIENGKLIFSSVTGMNFEAAKEANAKFDNAQLILVGINDKHILAALDDHSGTGGEYIGFVIPYHASGAKIQGFISELVKNLGETWVKTNYKDYSPVQTDKVRDNATEEQKARLDIRKKILTSREALTADELKLIHGTSKDIKGRSFAELRAIEKRALAGDQAALKEYLSWSAGVMQNLYEKMYAGTEKDTILNSEQAKTIMPHEYWDTKTTRANAYVNGFIFRSYCYSLGMKGRFSYTTGKGKNARGDFSDSDGYWKTLIDRPMYNNDGTYRAQQRINVTNFDNAMLTPAYAEKTYPNYKIQEPNRSRAARIGKEYGESLGKASMDIEEARQQILEDSKQIDWDALSLEIAANVVATIKSSDDVLLASGDTGKNQGGIRTVGQKLAKELTTTGRVNLNGRKLTSAAELGKLGQIFRNPKFETLRYIFVKDGTIVGSTAISSRMPGFATSFGDNLRPYELFRKIQRTDADTVYMLHNHPSGNPTPSREDVRSTMSLATWFEKMNLKFGGHVVVNHRKYSTISRVGFVETKNMPGRKSNDDLLYGDATVENPWLGEIIQKSSDIAEVGPYIVGETNVGVSAIIFTDSASKIRAIYEVPDKALLNDKQIPAFVRNRAVENGGRMAFVYTKSNDVYDAMKPLYEEGYFTDVVYDRSSMPVEERTGEDIDNSAMTVRETTAQKKGQSGETLVFGKTPSEYVGHAFSRDLDRDSYDFSKSFEEQVKDWVDGVFPEKDALIIGPTPEVLKNIGLNPLPMTINQVHVDYAINGTKNQDHTIGEDGLKQLPESIKNPVAIIASRSPDSKSTSIVMLLPFTHNGNTVIAPVYVDAFSKHNGLRIHSNAVTSVHGRHNAVNMLKQALEDEDKGVPSVFYVNKKETAALFAGARVTMPKVPQTNNGYIHMITDPDSPVKPQITSQTETLQFKRWFKGSKVTYKDKTPRIVYHWTDNDFTVFDPSRSGNNQGKTHGDGIYLSTSPDEFSYAGGKRMDLYASITKPFEMQLTRSQAETVYEKYFAPFHNDKFNTYKPHVIDKLQTPSRVFDYLIEAAEKNNTTTSKILTDLGFDGVHDGSEWVAFSSNQVKSATDNIGTFDGNNPDIRYSIDLGDSALEQENRQLRQDLSELRQQLKQKTESRDYWRGQTKTTEGRHLRTDDINHLAGELIKSGDSAADKAEIGKQLKDLGEYILNTTDNLDLLQENARMKSYEIAHAILDNSKALREKGGDEFYQDFRDRLKAGKVYVPQSVRNELAVDDWNKWRLGLSGTVTLTADPTKGKSIDQLYQDLMNEFGEWLLPADITSEADELNQILEVVDTYRPIYENLNSYEMAEAVEWMSNEILTRVIGDGIREMQPTYADRMEKKLAKQKAKHQEALKQVRQQRDEAVKNLKAHYQEMAEDKRIKRANSEARSKLLRIANRLNNKKLSRVQRELLDRYIGDLDLVSKGITGKTIHDLQGLQNWYNAYKKHMGENFIPDRAIEDRLDRLTKKRISDMTQEEVADLTLVLQNFENMVRTENELIESQIKHDVYAAGQRVIEDIKNSRGRTGFLNKYISTETATPEREAHRLTGYNDADPLYVATKELSDGQRKALDYQMRAEDLFDEWVNNRSFIRRIAGKHAQEIEVPAIVDGERTKVVITPAMRMSLYLHEKNDDNMTHITKGGVSIPDMKLYKQGKIEKAYEKATLAVFTRGMIRDIASKMSPEEKAFADAVYRYYNGMSRDAINEVSELLKGYSLAGVENYYPIDTDGTFLSKEFDAIKRDGSIEGMGMLKERIQGATTPIMLYDMNDTLAKSIQQHSKYYGLAIPVRNFQKLYNANSFANREIDYEYDPLDRTDWRYDTSVIKTLQREWGSAATRYIEKMIADVSNGTGLKRDVWGELMARARSRYAGAVLTTNMSVAAKQMASYPTAAAVVGYGPLLKALKDRNSKVNLDLVKKYTPLLDYRMKGFSNPELGDIGKEHRHIPKLLNWIQAADTATTRKLWLAAEYYVRENTKLERGTDAYYKEVASIYNRIIEETQPNYTMMQRPQILRSDSDLTRALNMFRTQPFQNFNILYDAFWNLDAKTRQYKAAGTEEALNNLKEARKNFARAVSSQAISAFVFSMMQYVWDSLRGKDKKYRDDDGEKTIESWMKGMGINALSSVGGMVPFGGYLLELGESTADAISKALGHGAIFDQTFYGLSENASDAWNDMGKAIISLVTKSANALIGKASAETTARGVVDAIGDVGQFFGIPANNVVKTAQMVARNVFLKMDGQYIGGYEALRVTTDPAKYTSDYYDLLYKAYTNDPAAYAEIKRLMLNDSQTKANTNGEMTPVFTEEKITNAMRDRKKAQMDRDAAYKAQYEAITSNRLWDQADAKQKDEAMNRLTQYYMQTVGLGNDTGADLEAKIAGGEQYGLTSAEYILYKLALSMADEDGNGSYKNEEVTNAINMVPGLSNQEKAYLWDAQGNNAKSNPWK